MFKSPGKQTFDENLFYTNATCARIGPKATNSKLAGIAFVLLPLCGSTVAPGVGTKQTLVCLATMSALEVSGHHPHLRVMSAFGPKADNPQKRCCPKGQYRSGRHGPILHALAVPVASLS
jgi:hypothetical protein